MAAIEEPGTVVTEVARREDVSTSLVYKWRWEARRASSASGFAKVVLEDATAVSRRASETELGAIFVEMKDARVRIGVNASPALIAATLKALRS